MVWTFKLKCMIHFEFDFVCGGKWRFKLVCALYRYPVIVPFIEKTVIWYQIILAPLLKIRLGWNRITMGLIWILACTFESVSVCLWEVLVLVVACVDMRMCWRSADNLRYSLAWLTHLEDWRDPPVTAPGPGTTSTPEHIWLAFCFAFIWWVLVIRLRYSCTLWTEHFFSLLLGF